MNVRDRWNSFLGFMGLRTMMDADAPMPACRRTNIRLRDHDWERKRRRERIARKSRRYNIRHHAAKR